MSWGCETNNGSEKCMDDGTGLRSGLFMSPMWWETLLHEPMVLGKFIVGSEWDRAKLAVSTPDLQIKNMDIL